MNKEAIVWRMGAVLLSLSAGIGCGRPVDDSLREGYSWKNCGNIQASFPAPSGWHVREDNVRDARACFINKERISQGSFFETGLSVNTISQTQRKMHQKPSEVAKGFAQEAGRGASSNPVERIDGPLRYYRVEAEVNMPQLGRSVRMIVVGVSNDAADLTYLMTFETPSAEWSLNQQIGETMIGQARINPNFRGIV